MLIYRSAASVRPCILFSPARTGESVVIYAPVGRWATPPLYEFNFCDGTCHLSGSRCSRKTRNLIYIGWRRCNYSGKNHNQTACLIVMLYEYECGFSCELTIARNRPYFLWYFCKGFVSLGYIIDSNYILDLLICHNQYQKSLKWMERKKED